MCDECFLNEECRNQHLRYPLVLEMLFTEQSEWNTLEYDFSANFYR